ncbi:uncharacterized protein B0H64DRAFT_437340 [Chaetomium fimeti]|uniref:SET domain-containing protein n=1 Tax=Chaetomium fimeti TaxID=1854472 RepID=A0AAE0HPF8_9PEZI|nr:hypothetical protein B0H64DRAFT_437340 [Chaetomium fimeti]
MSLSKDTRANATVALGPCDDKSSNMDGISCFRSADGSGNEAPMPPHNVAADAVEKAKVLPQTANEHQPKTISEHATETASLAEHLTQHEVEDNDSGRGGLGLGTQSATVTKKPECEEVDMLPNPGVISEAGGRTSLESLETEIELPGDSSSPQQLLPLAATQVALLEILSKTDFEAIEASSCADEQELMEPSAEIVPTSSRTGTPPADVGPEQQEEQPEGYIAMPPSPAGNVGNVAAGVEDFFKVQRSDLGGLGAFAARELLRGDTILVERPLLRTTHFRLLPDYHKLSDAAKKAYLSLHSGEDGDPFGRIEQIKVLNSFFVPGGIAIFEVASRFNHACPSARNVKYVFDDESGVLTLTICQDVVPAGAELFISYGGSPVELYSTYGFRCACGGCKPLTDEDIKRLKNRAFGTWDCDDDYDTSGW